MNTKVDMHRKAKQISPLNKLNKQIKKMSFDNEMYLIGSCLKWLCMERKKP